MDTIKELPSHDNDPSFIAHNEANDTTTQLHEEALTARDILAHALKHIAANHHSSDYAKKVAANALEDAKLT